MVETSEKLFIGRMFTREREYLMYEVFIEKGVDVFAKKANLDREHRPLVKHFAF